MFRHIETQKEKPQLPTAAFLDTLNDSSERHLLGCFDCEYKINCVQARAVRSGPSTLIGFEMNKIILAAPSDHGFGETYAAIEHSRNGLHQMHVASLLATTLAAPGEIDSTNDDHMAQAQERHRVAARQALRQQRHSCVVSTDRNYPPLQSVHKPTVPTDQAAYYLDRRSQTMRVWACHGTGPIRPLRINGRLAWPTAVLRTLLGLTA